MACLLYHVGAIQDPLPPSPSWTQRHKTKSHCTEENLLFQHEGNDICPAQNQHRMAETTPGDKCPSICPGQYGNSRQTTLSASRPIDNQTMHYVTCLWEGALHLAPQQCTLAPVGSETHPLSSRVLLLALPLCLLHGVPGLASSAATSSLLQQKPHPA